MGLSALYHDSAAAIVRDGEIIAAAQEERFTRIKHDFSFPVNAVNYCLKTAGVTPQELDAVVFYDKPLQKFERLLETYLAYAPRGFLSFAKAMPLWLKQKLFIPKEIDKNLSGYDGPIYFTSHHESHASSAFFPSPFDNAAIITIDGVGEWATTTLGVGQGNKITLTHEIEYPHSLGLFYSAFTYFLGFAVNSGEYKVMGLAPYGEPRYVNLILDHLIKVKLDGSFWLNQQYFNYSQGLTMTSSRFEKLFGIPRRKSEGQLNQKHMDIARSLQEVTELIMLRIARYARKETGMPNLCLAGGCALNCVANGKIVEENIFDNVWIQPASGDAGGALGAALFYWYQLQNAPRKAKAPDSQYGSYLGPQFSQTETRKYLDGAGAIYEALDEVSLYKSVAAHLNAGRIVGHVAGRMEFGPRALGNRSIIGDARNTQMQKTMNLKIKFRESFRPFAPACMEEDASDYFEMEKGFTSPYMLLTAPVKRERRALMTKEEQSLFGIEKLNIVRSDIPAITHVDYSARLQTVSKESNPRFYGIINAFKELTGYGIVVNTSFNIRGEPIVCTPENAYKCFMCTEMDVLVIENCILLKSDQPPFPGAEEYKRQFRPD